MPVLIVISTAGVLAASKEKENAREIFALEMAQLHSKSVNVVCSKLVSKAFNIDTYKHEYTNCVSTVEAEFPESMKPL